jgi:thiol peroxidase
MAHVTFKGNPVDTNGEIPAVGEPAPDFVLTNRTLEDVSLESFGRRRKVITVNPSLDTRVCAATARRFNERAAACDDTVVLVVSSDLPFAQKRFCEAEGLDRVETLSVMRDRSFAKDWGLLMTSGPLAGLVARAVFVLDENNQVVHAQLVPEIAEEPDYDAALSALH